MIQSTLKSCQKTNNTFDLMQYINKTSLNSSVIPDSLIKSWILSNPIIKWTISLFLIIATGTTFFGNLLIILAFITNSRLRRITDQYIVSLAVADLLVSVLVLPLAIVRQNLGYWPFESDRLCQFWLSANIVLCMASILNLCCISLDRYIAISRPMKYFTKRTRFTASTMIAVAWILPLITMLLPFVGGNQHTLGLGSCHITYNKAYRIYSSIVGFFGPFLLIAYIYLRVFWIIKHRLKVLQITNIKLSSLKKPKSHIKATRKPAPIIINLQQVWENIKGKIGKVNILRNQSSKSKNTCPYSGHFFHSDENGCNQIYASCLLNHKHPFDSFRSDDILNEEIDRNYRQKILDIKMNKTDREFSLTSQDHVELDFPEPTDQKLKVIQIFNISTSEKELQKANWKPTPNVTLKSETKQHQHDYLHRSNEEQKNKLGDKQLINSSKLPSLTSFSIDHIKKLRRLKSLPNFKTEYNKTEQSQKNLIYYRHDHFIFHREQKTALILAAVVGCFTICWFPFFICIIGEAICDCQYSNTIITFVSWLGYFNSICNPFIYAFFKKEYAKSFKYIIQVNKWNIKSYNHK
uniref:Putative g-protein coupled receptor n=2 Tax=Schistosoma mansoni TaxID=6183 RepID=A0A3Q0KF28_SCHMA